MKALHKVTFVLLVIGGLNWGLQALGWNPVDLYLPASVGMVVYLLVGLSALYEAFTHKSSCKACAPAGQM